MSQFVKIFSDFADRMDHMKDANKKTQFNWIANNQQVVPILLYGAHSEKTLNSNKLSLSCHPVLD